MPNHLTPEELSKEVGIERTVHGCQGAAGRDEFVATGSLRRPGFVSVLVMAMCPFGVPTRRAGAVSGIDSAQDRHRNIGQNYVGDRGGGPPTH